MNQAHVLNTWNVSYTMKVLLELLNHICEVKGYKKSTCKFSCISMHYEWIILEENHKISSIYNQIEKTESSRMDWTQAGK